MFDLEKLNSQYQESLRPVGKFARTIGKWAVSSAQSFIDLGHGLFGQEGYETLKKAANINSVSGCMTRRGMFRALNEKLDNDRPGQLLITYVDIVNFKDVNDRFGQVVGDQVLAVTGWGLRQIFKTEDGVDTDALVGAWGGDEFMCVLPADAAMHSDVFAGSIDFDFEDGERSGQVTWNFGTYLERLNEQKYSESTPFYSTINGLVSRGVEEVTFRYTFDVVDVGDLDRAQDIIDEFASHNTIKTATHLRGR